MDFSCECIGLYFRWSDSLQYRAVSTPSMEFCQLEVWHFWRLLVIAKYDTVITYHRIDFIIWCCFLFKVRDKISLFYITHGIIKQSWFVSVHVFSSQQRACKITIIVKLRFIKLSDNIYMTAWMMGVNKYDITLVIAT